MQLRPDTVAVAVVHVDASWRNPPVLHAAQQAAVVNQVLAVAARHGGSEHTPVVRVVQLGFEVRQLQRAFLSAVVQDVRRQLPADTALSITALASRCAGDYWLHDLPADEIVPMARRMGRDDLGRHRRSRVMAPGVAHAAHCCRANWPIRGHTPPPASASSNPLSSLK